jgi:transposase-like protein
LVPIERVLSVASLGLDAAAHQLGVSRSTIKRWRRQVAESGGRGQTTAVEG